MYEKDIITAKEQTFFLNVCISVLHSKDYNYEDIGD